MNIDSQTEISTAKSETSPSGQSNRRWYQRLGPGLVTVCVVIGPGSIMTSSTIGANDRYAFIWVVVVSVLFMLLFTTLGAKLGLCTQDTPGALIRKKAGRWLSIALGLSVFFISAAFQSGNNIGVASALESFVEAKWLVAAFVVTLNAIAIAFLFAFRDLYAKLERVMASFVGIMLLCFAINLVALGPDPMAMLSGLKPTMGKSGDMLRVLGLIGTTFVIAAAFFQAYLVKQKGWNEEQVSSGLWDARVASAIMFLITLMLMSTAAAGLYTGEPVTLANPIEVASALEATFGGSAKMIFCLGLFCAAYSSFLINSMIGGFMAADGLGLSCDAKDFAPRILTALVLVAGMLVGIAVLIWDFDRTPTIIAAQAVTVVVAPLVAIVLLWLTSSRDVMGRHVNAGWVRALGGLGVLLLVAMALKTALVDLPPKIGKYMSASVPSAKADSLPSITPSQDD